MAAEGWYDDPFEVHEHRWFSDGRPTALVRDAHVESSDPPPVATYDGMLTEAATFEPRNGADMIRSGEDAVSSLGLEDEKDAAWEAATTGAIGYTDPH